MQDDSPRGNLALDRQARDIFLDALEIREPEARAAYLNGACKEKATLRARVDALLESHREDAFLETAVDRARPTVADQTPLTEGPGARIGRYKLLQQIGEGGCGTVFMAEQEEPVRRRVALKVIKLGMDTKSVVARFEAERQALAMMDHSNIARVLDAGATDSGRPYFVMELVKGIPITRFCNENKLTVRQRLDLFIPVCQAIQHAHQKGIIHRDIKPSNILVALHDVTAVPKVIDFGIAKAIEGKLTDATLFTAFEQFIGTPAYMSPEQAQLSGLDIDTRSDIYSLGVLLYELLTDQTPFDAKELIMQGIDAIRRTIREVEPSRPSTRLSTLREEPSTAAAKTYGADALNLATLVRGDLDWIVMKCLEKDRSRRYETANVLAADITRHLTNEPVVARPPSAAYRFQKAYQRNKAAFAVTALIGVILLAATTFSTWQRNIAISTNQQLTSTISELRTATELGAKQRVLVESTNQQLTNTVSQLTSQIVRNYRSRSREAMMNQSPSQALFWTSLAVSNSPESNLNGDLNLELTSLLPAYRMGEVLEHGDGVRGAQLTRDETQILSWGHDNSIRLWDAKSGDLIGPSMLHQSNINGAQFSIDETRILSWSHDKTIRIWDVKSGEQIGRSILHESAVIGARFNGEETRILSWSVDKTIRLWDASSGEQIGVSMLHESLVNGAQFNRDDTRILSWSFDKTIRLWDAKSGEQIGDSMLHEGTVRGAQFNKDETRILSWSQDNTLRLWDAKNGEQIGDSMLHEGTVRGAQFNKDETRILSCSWDNTIRLWDTESGDQIGASMLHKGYVNGAQFNGDETRILSWGGDNTIRLWDARSGDQIGASMLHEDRVVGAQFNKDETHILSWSDDKTIRFWDAKRDQQNEAFMLHGDEVSGAQFNGDETRILSYSFDKSIRIWEAKSGEQIGDSMLHDGRVIRAQFNRDETRILSYSFDKSIRIWDAKSGKQIGDSMLHDSSIIGAQFSVDETRILSWSMDNTLRLWDANSGQQIGPSMVST